MEVSGAKSRRRGALLRAGIHVIFCTQFTFAAYYDHTYTIIPDSISKNQGSYGGRFKFLTFLNVILQAVFFLVCVANDFFGSNELAPKKRPILRRVKDFLHASLGFPVAMFVGATFWALMAIDRELVLPAAVDPYFPSWLNHLMHTLIVFSTVFEMIISPRQYPKRLIGIGGLLVFMLIYLTWMIIVYTKSGVWVYPVMEVLSLPLRVLFLASLFGFCVVLYMVGEFFDRLIWGRARKSTGKSVKKKK